MALPCVEESKSSLGAHQERFLSETSSCPKTYTKKCVVSGCWKDISRVTDLSSGKTIIEAKPKKTICPHGITPAMSRMALIHEVAVSKVFVKNNVPYVIVLEPIYYEKKEKASQLKSVHMEDCVLQDASIVFKAPPRTAQERKQRLVVALQVALALKGIHAVGFAHHDVKPDNILLTLDKGELSAKLSDFGFSKRIGIGITGKPGTPIYLPPDILGSCKKEVRPETDMWAFGLSLLEMYHGEKANLFLLHITQEYFLLPPSSLKSVWNSVLSAIKKTLDEKDPVDALIKQLLSVDPSQRPTSNDLVVRLEAILEQYYAKIS